jgi:glycosylphosphatidylinositol transamidase (GPIT) subunit GPI8
MSESEQKISIEKKKKFCMNYINKININQRITISKLILLKIDPKYISEHPDGTRIMIDEIDDSIITDLYNLLKNCLNQYNEL